MLSGEEIKRILDEIWMRDHGCVLNPDDYRVWEEKPNESKGA